MSVMVESRERATEHFKQKHGVVTRRSGAGDRREWKLERLLKDGYIGPPQSDAGWRWVHDYLMVYGGGGRSCLDISPKGFGGDGAEGREDASRALDVAKASLDLKRSPAGGALPSQIVTWFCVEDRSFSDIAMSMGAPRDKVKPIIKELLDTLASHYAWEDRRTGKSSTAQTHEAAAARFEPEVADKAAGG